MIVHRFFKSGRIRRRVIVTTLLVCALLTVWAYVANTISLRQARLARRVDDYSEAEKRLAGCWRLPGHTATIELEDALIAVQQGDLHAEESWQNKSTSRTEGAELILEALSKGNLAAFNWAKAENYAQSIIGRNSEAPRALWLRGRARVNMQQETDALQDFQHALELAPELWQVRRSLADLLYQTGHVRSALKHYQHIYRQRDFDDALMSAIARCLQDETQLQEAGKLVDAWLERDPKSIAALLERARISLRMGTPVAAEQFARQALAVNADHADANFVLNLALQAQQKSDAEVERRVDANARRQAELKLKLHESKHTPELLTEVGNWMLRVGTEGEAPAWLYSALQEEPTHKPAHLELAKFFRRDGQLRRAAWHEQMGGLSATAAQGTAAEAPFGKTDSNFELAVDFDAEIPEAQHADVERLCAACHQFPVPESMPRAAWREEVKQGYGFLHDSNLSGDFASLESVVRYYESRAPENFPAIESVDSDGASPFKFETRGTGWLPNQPPFPAIANARLANLSDNFRQDLLLCDSRLDAVLVLKPYETTPGGMVLRELTAPCHSTVCDLDRDGHKDIIVASLGNFFPSDDQVGKVLWLQGGPGNQFQSHTLLENVGRVADVQVSDFNGDDRLDLVVAAFGWRNTGAVLYLENHTTDWSDPQFITNVVDARHGAIHVPVVDLNGDRLPDILALISQEYEQVIAYQNDGNGTFAASTLFTAPHPSFGCSGIEPVDIDGDGDLDVLLTNGDVMDRPHVLKPYHGVQWLENQGSFPYTHHPIGAMYGAARAVAADFDGDGDQDVAAVSMLPKALFPEREARQLPSIAIFEQLAGTQFRKHVLEVGTCDHFSCSAGDWDRDGRVDLTVSNFAWDNSQPLRDAATLWRNVGK